MARLCLHVGPHKTGSTSIQSSYYHSRESLLSEGILYPRSIHHARWPKSHNDLAACATQNDIVGLSRFFSQLAMSATRHAIDIIIISGEDFSSLFVNDRLSMVLRIMDDHFDVEVWFVQRDLKAVLLSSVVHIMVTNSDKLRAFGSVEQYVANSLEYNRQKLSYFANVGANFIDYRHLRTEAFAEDFHFHATGRSFSFGNVQLNTMKDHQRALEGMPGAELDQMCEFFGVDRIRPALQSDTSREATAKLTLEAISRRVIESYTRALSEAHAHADGVCEEGRQLIQ